MTDKKSRFVEQPEDIDTMITILDDEKKTKAKSKDSTDEAKTSDSKSKTAN